MFPNNKSLHCLNEIKLVLADYYVIEMLNVLFWNVAYGMCYYFILVLNYLPKPERTHKWKINLIFQGRTATLCQFPTFTVPRKRGR